MASGSTLSGGPGTADSSHPGTAAAVLGQQPSWDSRDVKSSCSQRSPLPPQSGPLQSHLHIHVLAAIVRDNDAEMRVSSDLGQALHISDELLHPASLVLHYPGRPGKEKTARVKER